MNVFFVAFFGLISLAAATTLEKFTAAEGIVNEDKEEFNFVVVDKKSDFDEFDFDSLIPEDPTSKFIMGFTAVALFTATVLRPFGKVVVKRS